MTSLDNLPDDERAVLTLVLGRGRSYDELAGLLSIDREAVRQRALSALDVLGPRTELDLEQRLRICDYLLSQLSVSDAVTVRDGMAGSASEREWARAVSVELAPVADGLMPEIPAEASGAAEPSDPEPSGSAAPPDPGPGTPGEPDPPPPAAETPEQPDYAAPPAAETPEQPDYAAAPAAETPEQPEYAAPPAAETPEQPEYAAPPAAETPEQPDYAAPPAAETPEQPEYAAPPAAETLEPAEPRGSGRARVFSGLAVVIVIVVLVLVLHTGSSKPKGSAASNATKTTPAGASASGSATASVIARVPLAPTAAGSRAAGIAEVLDEGTINGFAVVGENLAAHGGQGAGDYAVWLYNGPHDAQLLGTANVAGDGRLSAAGTLPANARRYRQLIVTLETSANPNAPGPIVLQGTLTGV